MNDTVCCIVSKKEMAASRGVKKGNLDRCALFTQQSSGNSGIKLHNTYRQSER